MCVSGFQTELLVALINTLFKSGFSFLLGGFLFCFFRKGAYSVLVIVLRSVFGKVKNTDPRKGSREALFCNGNVKEFEVVFGIRICGFDIFPLEAVCDCS